MSRTRLTQQARRAKTREALIRAASKLFAVNGVEATSLDQVAETAGFTKGAIYANFPNKRALINAVVDRHVVSIDPAPMLRPDLTLAERLAIMGREVAALAGSISHETVLLDLEYSLHLLRNPKRRAAELARFHTGWQDLPQRFEAVNAAQGAEPPFATGELLQLTGILARGILRGVAENPGALTPGTIETVFRMLAGVGAESAATRKKGRGGAGKKRKA